MKEYIITIDGGTTNTRCILWGSGQRRIDEERRAVGVRNTSIDGSNSKLKQAVRECIEQLLERNGVTYDQIHRIIGSGMITSDVGLVVVPWITAPAGVKELAANIAEISLLFSRQGEVKVPQDIGVMACKAGLMVRQAISSYTGRDVETAHAVVNLDDEVDELFRKIKGDLINQVADNLDEADLSIDFIIIAKYLERIADHAVNIAQWAIFCVTGEL